MHLMYIPPQVLFSDGHGRFGLDGKALSGMREYSKLWSGTVTLASPGQAVSVEDATGVEWFREEDESFQVLVDSSFPTSVIRQSPDVVLALHRADKAYFRIMDAGIPLVLTSEQDFGTRLDIQLTGGKSLLARARAGAGVLRREPTLRRLAQRAKGLQCNGFAAWNGYGRLSPNPLLFHDHRMASSDMAAASEVAPWDGRRALQLGFSGRLIDIKGPHHFIELAEKLKNSHPEIRLHVLGTGPLEQRLRSAAGANVTFEGYLDFESKWKKFVRRNIDVMVLPHTQADPSCTYFETLGCGVPILGFDNRTLSPLVADFGVGWTAPQRDVSAIADWIERIISDPSLLWHARENGLNFMRQRTFSSVSAARIDHLRAVAREPKSSRDQP